MSSAFDVRLLGTTLQAWSAEKEGQPGPLEVARFPVFVRKATSRKELVAAESL